MSAGPEPRQRVLRGNVPTRIASDMVVVMGVDEEAAGVVARLAVSAAGVDSDLTLSVGDAVSIGGTLWRVTDVKPATGRSETPFGDIGSRLVLTAIAGDS